VTTGPVRRIRAAVARTPLRIKLVGTVLILATTGFALAAVLTTTALHGYLLSRIDDQLRTFSTGPGGHDFDFRGPEQGGGPGGNASGSPEQPRLPSQFYVARFGPTGARINTYAEQLVSESPPALPVLTTSTASRLSHHAFTVASRDGSSSWRVMAVVIPDGSGTVAVATSLTDMSRTVEHVIWLEAGIGLVLLVMIGLAGYLVINRALRPLVSVEHTAAAIAAGDLTQRVPELPAGTEVGQLSIALNTMLTQIEDAFAHEHSSEQQARASEARMRQFVADASHELRTPLTSIRGFAELFRIGAADDAADLPRLMSRIETEAARIGLLVEDLLMLARLDQQRPLAHEPVDLLAIASDVVHDAQLVATDRSISLDVSVATAAIVAGDEARLRQVLHNVMTNALTHTPAGTPVDVTVRTTGDLAEVAIADRGPGIAQEHVERIFERFYRADESRHRGSGGAGLGLSIVSGLVAAHGGTVAVVPRDGGGSTFVITLPLAEAAEASSS
jgi:two-component system OmpR family sensor kinase